MDEITFPMLLIFLGFGGLLLALELFVTPGVGIKGFMGVALVVGAVAISYHRYGSVKGTLMLVLGVALLGGLGWIGKRTMGRRLVLGDAVATPPAAEEGLEELAGAEGVAVSALRPSGIAHVGGHRIDVSCEGDFIDKDTRIRVVSVHGNRVLVERA